MHKAALTSQSIRITLFKTEVWDYIDLFLRGNIKEDTLLKQIGFLKALILTSKYNNLSNPEREALRDIRLKALVAYAKSNSPYFKNLFKEVGENFKLSDLPVTNKRDMMEHFDDWITDREIRLDGIIRFLDNPDNIGRKLNGKYMVFTTSGSTGNPSVVLCDKTTNNIMGAVNTLRSIARPEDMKKLILRGFKTAGVFATGGFYLGNSSVRSRLLKMPWKKRQMMVTSVLHPLPKIVAELNGFQPAMLGGYPTALELLIEEQKSGRLHISPVLIMAGGEYLSDTLREQLREAFGCYVQTSYSCTEGGTVAYECAHQHFHINDDWLIVETADKENGPVPGGVQSDKILLTNLFNFTQPLIRFEITDRVTIHYEPCPCKNPSPWLEIEGRTDDILTFKSNDKQVKIPPLALYAILKEVHEMKRFQLVQIDGCKLLLRMKCHEFQRQIAFKKAKAAVNIYLSESGIDNIHWELSDEAPQRNAKSGKFKHIYAEY